MAPKLMTEQDVQTGLSALHAGWSGGTERIVRTVEFADFPTAVEFVDRLAPRCEELNHHPDLALRWRRVQVELSTHSAGGVTDLDLRLAEIVDEIAAGLPQA